MTLRTRPIRALLVAAALTLPLQSARAAPCEGCLVAPTTEPGPAPLLVVLHGDEGSPRKVFDAWGAVARDRHVALFAPKCPRAEGCSTGSWWRWAGSPQWLAGEVDRVTAELGVDPERRYLAGWSGGSSYLGYVSGSWSETFAALAIAGGGMPPRGTCDRCPSPIYYLMGDENPLFDLAMDTKAALARCGHAIDFHLLPGKNHAGEWRVYASRDEQNRALDFLLTKTRGRCAPTADASSNEHVVTPTPSSSAAASNAAASSADASGVVPSNAAASAAAHRDVSATSDTQTENAPAASRGCACDLGGGASKRGLVALACLVGAVALRRSGARLRA